MILLVKLDQHSKKDLVWKCTFHINVILVMPLGSWSLSFAKCKYEQNISIDNNLLMKKAFFWDCSNSSKIRSTKITIDLHLGDLLVKNVFTEVMSKIQFTSKEQLTIS